MLMVIRRCVTNTASLISGSLFTCGCTDERRRGWGLTTAALAECQRFGERLIRLPLMFPKKEVEFRRSDSVLLFFHFVAGEGDADAEDERKSLTKLRRDFTKKLLSKASIIKKYSLKSILDNLLLQKNSDE